MVGTTLTHRSQWSSRSILAGSTVVGLALGQGIHQLLRRLTRTSGDSTPRPEDYVNKMARVTVRIVPPKMGEVVVRVGRGDRYVPAISHRADRSFQTGEQVAVMDYRDGIAVVVSREEHDFLSAKT